MEKVMANHPNAHVLLKKIEDWSHSDFRTIAGRLNSEQHSQRKAAWLEILILSKCLEVYGKDFHSTHREKTPEKTPEGEIHIAGKSPIAVEATSIRDTSHTDEKRREIRYLTKKAIAPNITSDLKDGSSGYILKILGLRSGSPTSYTEKEKDKFCNYNEIHEYTLLRDLITSLPVVEIDREISRIYSLIKSGCSDEEEILEEYGNGNWRFCISAKSVGQTQCPDWKIEMGIIEVPHGISMPPREFHPSSHSLWENELILKVMKKLKYYDGYQNIIVVVGDQEGCTPDYMSTMRSLVGPEVWNVQNNISTYDASKGLLSKSQSLNNFLGLVVISPVVLWKTSVSYSIFLNPNKLRVDDPSLSTIFPSTWNTNFVGWDSKGDFVE